jgi:hypothetical protein
MQLLSNGPKSLDTRKLITLMQGLLLVKREWEIRKHAYRPKPPTIPEPETQKKKPPIISKSKTPSRAPKPPSRATKPLTQKALKTQPTDRSDSQPSSQHSHPNPDPITQHHTQSDPASHPTFSQRNHLEHSNLQKFPNLHSHLLKKGTELSQLGLGEDFSDESQKHYPSWFNKYKQEARAQKIDDLSLVYGFQEGNLDKISSKEMRMLPQEKLFQMNNYKHFFDVLNGDIKGEMGIQDVGFYLK